MRVHPSWDLVIVGFSLVFVGAGFWNARHLGQASGPVGAPGLERGQMLYAAQCAVCHGPEGKGDGPAAFVLFPKPRDLTSGKFKIRSTPTVPTDADLFRVISQGIPGTSMPPWSHLPEADRWALVAYVKKLAGLLDQAPPEPIEVPEPPPPTPERLALGKKLYTELGCGSCHGPEGRGDGPAAASLRDEWGQPIVPYDFTIPGRMKGGSTVRDVYRTLWVGIGGTPMPSYAPLLDPEKTWALAYYVLSLTRPGAETPEPAQETTTLEAPRVRGRVPRDPLDGAWTQIPAVRVRLRPLWERRQFVETLTVRVVHDGREVAFLLEWDDPVQDQAFLRHQDFRDAVAVQFPVRPGGSLETAPSFVMGDAQGAVNIWHWKADWEADLRKFADVSDVYPNMAWDDYPFQTAVPAASRGDRPAQAPLTAFDPTFLPAWKVGNTFSNLRRVSPVEDLNATGPGTLTPQPPGDQDVGGRGVWQGGRWHVVMVRRLQTRSDRDVQLRPGGAVPVAFAVWDGAHGDRDGQKSVSTWLLLRLAP